MIRTIIRLDPGDKEWLERKAQSQGVSVSQLVREAIRRMRQQDIPFEKLLQQMSGLWQKGDGLTYQRRIRKEWR